MPWHFEYPLERELRKMGYNEKYIIVKKYYNNEEQELIMPEGIKGEELLKLRKSLDDEYKMIEKNDPALDYLHNINKLDNTL